MDKILLILVFLPVVVFGQFRIDKFEEVSIQTDVSRGKEFHFLRYNTHNYSLSNFSTNQFEKEAQSGQISDETKNYVSENLPEINRRTYIIDIELDYQFEVNKSSAVDSSATSGARKSFLNFGLRSNNFSNSTFQKDLTLLLLNGNSPYEDQLLQLSPSEVYNYRTQELYLGYTKKISNWLVGAELGYLKGSYLRSFDIERGSLYTHPNATQVDLDIRYKDVQTNQDKSEVTRFAGHGANLNLYVQYQKGKSTVRAQVRNLGFVAWQNQIINEADTSLNYTGFDIISNSGNSFNNGEDINEVLDTEPRNGNVTKMLPSLIHGEYQYAFSKKFNIAAGAKYYLNVNNLPQMYVRPNYTIVGKKFGLDLSAILAGGGFSRFDLGLGAKFQYQQVFVYLDSFQLEQLISSEKSHSAGFSIGVGFQF